VSLLSQYDGPGFLPTLFDTNVTSIRSKFEDPPLFSIAPPLPQATLEVNVELLIMPRFWLNTAPPCLYSSSAPPPPQLVVRSALLEVNWVDEISIVPLVPALYIAPPLPARLDVNADVEIRNETALKL
jgi:hypothetical protein